ncbi:hypothetical protein M8J77_025213 [Diaphorina citri]|nr:hypothetical protein M8J77_025213 [Diaphorina citri]
MLRIKFHTSAGIEPTPSCLPGERLDHYTTKADQGKKPNNRVLPPYRKSPKTCGTLSLSKNKISPVQDKNSPISDKNSPCLRIRSALSNTRIYEQE